MSRPFRRLPSAAAAPLLPLLLASGLAAAARAQEGPSATMTDEAHSNVMAEEAAEGALNPAQQARMKLSSANRSVAQAEKLEAKQAAATDPKKRQELHEKAEKAYNSAIADYQAALKLDPKLVEGYVGLAQLMVKSGKIEQAIQVTEKALELDPGSIKALLARGRAQLAGFQVSEAKATYERLVAESAKAGKEFLAEIKGWLDAQRARLGPEMAEAVTELERWIGERE
jgi:tetratricopeptide (TPR) repeat protein